MQVDIPVTWILWAMIYSDTSESHFLPVGKAAASLQLLGHLMKNEREKEFGVELFVGLFSWRM